MTSLHVTSNTEDGQTFVVRIAGHLQDRRSLNAAMANRLCEDLKVYFQSRSEEPNQMGAPSSGFWNDQAASTGVLEVSETGAIVGAGDYRLKIHVFGGVIRPTGGRKFLTIPLIAAARGLRVSNYEQESGNKLFRLPGSRVLVERNDQGDRSNIAGGKVTIRTKAGDYRKLTIRGRSQIRAVYALATKSVIPKDPFALPLPSDLAASIAESGNAWLATLQTIS